MTIFPMAARKCRRHRRSSRTAIAGLIGASSSSSRCCCRLHRHQGHGRQHGGDQQHRYREGRRQLRVRRCRQVRAGCCSHVGVLAICVGFPGRFPSSLPPASSPSASFTAYAVHILPMHSPDTTIHSPSNPITPSCVTTTLQTCQVVGVRRGRAAGHWHRPLRRHHPGKSIAGQEDHRVRRFRGRDLHLEDAVSV